MESRNTMDTTPQGRITLPPVMPKVVELTPRTNLAALWPRTASVQRYVFLVAYTMPVDGAGRTPPPRFRAYGVDLHSRTCVFAVDGERAAYLGTFLENMFQSGALLVGTPPGFMLQGQAPQPPTARAASTASADDGSGDGSGDGDNTVLGTEPVFIPVNPQGGGGGTDPDKWLKLTWKWLLSVVSQPNAVFTERNFQQLNARLQAQQPVADKTQIQVPVTKTGMP